MLKGGHLLSFADLTPDDVQEILCLAHTLKQQPEPNQRLLAGKTLAMIFEKPSTRTRVSFEVGMFQLGGNAINLAPGDIQMDGRETVPDVARTLSRMVDGILLRVYSHQTVQRFASASSVPVINGLSDFEHPCQALADLQTLQERVAHLSQVTMAYVGDGNNVVHSLMFAAAKVDICLRVCTPKGFEPLPEVLARLNNLGQHGAPRVELFNDPMAAVQGANVIYTDVWTSMGQEAESKKRLKKFKGYQVNAELLKRADPNCLVMHCLPAHRGEEISDEVLDGSQSIVFDQAENRLHAQKAVLALLMG